MLIRAATAIFLLLSPATLSAAEKDMEFFERWIRPLLAEHCYECHSARAEELKGDLLLDTRQGWEMGGRSGQVIRPGNPEQSLLIKAVRHSDPDLEMPLKKEKLPDNAIKLLTKWIRMGAPDPRTGGALANEQSLDRDNADHWAFQPPRSSSLPNLENSDWPLTGIDRFVLAGMSAHGLQPVADTDLRTLIRRLSFDLTGLPPRPTEIDDFVAAAAIDRQKAIANLVDRLLSSPHFGERWGRHWLDVARFAESSGHERNFTYPHAWRYRDYVIAAFNADKPYDQFIREQIAGDLLPYKTREEQVEQTVATAFLAIGPKNHLGRLENHVMDLADDQIDTTSKAVLGLTIACARCHDHKYDPVSTAEYHALAGIFTSTESLHGTVPGKGAGSNRIPTELFLVSGDPEEAKRLEAEHRKKIDALSDQARDVTKALVAAMKAHEKDPSPENEASVTELKAAKSKITGGITELQRNPPVAADYAMSVRDKEEPADTAVRIKGVVTEMGEVVPRGFPVAFTIGEPPAIDRESSGRRAFAEWLTNTRNPLTARVLVNRIWHHLFGKGFVRTVDNFGLLGAEPSHPELLDYLAVRCMEEGWSIKQMIRLLVTSRVYQLSSSHDGSNYEKDPDAIHLWRMRPRRLEAEPLRDAMMSVSGQLQLGAPPFGSVVATMGDGCLARQVRTDPLSESQPFRSIYLPVVRFYEPEMIKTFDGAPATFSIGRREVTNVPGQALFLLNNDFIISQSRHAARRLIETVDGDSAQRVTRAFELSLGRKPEAAELADALAFLERISNQAEDEPLEAAFAAFQQALFSTAEFRHIY